MFTDRFAPDDGNRMRPADTLDAHFALADTYQSLFAAYRQRGVVRDLDQNDKELVLDEDWKLPHYFQTGEDALRIIVGALIKGFRAPPRSILDFPSGSGRVTRHLRAFFPDAAVTASDLYPYHVDFCRDVLGADGVLSRENVRDLDFGRQFDLIFCGSLLTHLPEALFRDTIDLLTRSLSPDGIAVVTLQGRHSEYIQHHKWKYLDDRLFEIAETAVRETGFGYVDYQHDFKAKFDQQAAYGIALIRPHWVLLGLEARTDLRVISYTERDWDDHQDVLVFGRPGINA
jgi:SAM-dependent methyltransferase